ncbi:MAG: hypothetical protein K6T78_14015 [Alicyclobacillus sp.]|nr:hypothetical protein [Alicyclobacillus sp.]
MYCTNCGQLLNPTLPHCHNCGLPLGQQKPPESIFTHRAEDALRSRRSRARALRETGLSVVAIAACVVGFWSLTYWFLHVGVLDRKGVSGSDVISVVFDISSSTLTLVGLVTIFVSINSQHRIQRCREILWELMELPYDCWGDRGNFEYKFRLEQGIRQRFIAYREVLRSGRAFNYAVVFFVFIMITVVSAMITATVQALHATYFHSAAEFGFVMRAVSVGVAMMLCFALLILSLARITLIASLPDLHDLLDVDLLNTGVPSLLLAAICMRVIPSNPLMIRFPFPFQNLQIRPWIVGTERATGALVTVLGGPFEGESQGRVLTQSHVDASRAHRLRFLVLPGFDAERFTHVAYRFELRGRQGTVYVTFEHHPVPDQPKEDWLPPSGIAPKLTMENDLFA